MSALFHEVSNASKNSNRVTLTALNSFRPLSFFYSFKSIYTFLVMLQGFSIFLVVFLEA
jgi:hypothetical protein